MTDYQSEMSPMIAGYDLEWLINQLSKWPMRVDETRTTSMRYLMDAAAVTLRALADTASHAPIEVGEAGAISVEEGDRMQNVAVDAFRFAFKKAMAMMKVTMPSYQLEGEIRRAWDCYTPPRHCQPRLAAPLPPSAGEREPTVKDAKHRRRSLLAGYGDIPGVNGRGDW